MRITPLNVAHSRRIAEVLNSRLERPPGFENIVGASESMLKVLDRTKRAAAADSTVLITGESGTGKELIADAIRRNSPRRERPFITINMAAVPDTLVESELFGHVKGAFTGAELHRIGRLEAADGGTLFVDEIGDLALSAQAKVLRVLEDYKITPVGGNEDKCVDVRLVAATSRNLEQMICEREFREDLYYRLNVVNIHVPPLRQRRGDVLIFVKHFFHELCDKHGRPNLSIDEGLLQCLMDYDWPGNVRQLQNCLESMVVLARTDTLVMSDLPATVRNTDSSTDDEEGEPLLPDDMTLFELEKLAVIQRLEQCDGNRLRAARSLGISLRTLQRRLKKWRFESQRLQQV